jgi:uncharacterized protein YndB with AHSA1/START domain
MFDANLTKFIKRISINTSPNNVFKAWNTQEGLETWFLRKAEFTSVDGHVRSRNEAIQNGDTYLWIWHGYGDDVYEKRKILDSNGIDTLSFEFTGNCVVTVTAKIERGETVCELVQSRIPTAADITDHLYILCGEGWTFYLTNLKSILEGGIDLRNKNMELTRLVNA